MSDNLGAQPGGHLLGLPSEVRLLIYEQLFPLSEVELYHRYRQDTRDENFAILATCLAIYIEAKPVLYENSEFHVSLPSDAEDVDTEPPEGSKYPHDPQAEHDSWFQERNNGARPLLKEARKLCLTIFVAGTVDDELKWLDLLTSELTLLGEAPRLKEVHVELETRGYLKIEDKLKQVIGLISRAMHRAAVTVSIDPSLRPTDFQPSNYFELIHELNW